MRDLAGLIALALPLLPLGAAAAELMIPESGYVVSEDPEQLPPEVKATRDALLAAARSGDLAELKKVFDAQPSPPTVSFGEPEDPIKYLAEQSADGEGLEILAILADLLDAPYAAAIGGDGEAYYLWPYLAQMDDLGDLTPAQRVDGIRIVGWEGMKNEEGLGNWLWWRVSIGAHGELSAFVAGD